MKLRRPCEHIDIEYPEGRYEPHQVWFKGPGVSPFLCPGGVFLPDDTLIIEKVDGEWPQWAYRRIVDSLGARTVAGASLILDALSVREAE